MTFDDQWAKAICDLVDEFSKLHIDTDLPVFTFQQSLILHCKKYRESLVTCTDSGVTFPRYAE